MNEWLDKDVLPSLLALFEKDQSSAALVDYYTQLNNQIDFRNELQRKIWKPMIFTVMTFIVSIFSFLIFDRLNPHCLFLGAIILFLATFLTICYIVLYIKFAISGPQAEIINNPLTEDFKNLRYARIEQIKDRMRERIPIEKKKIKEELEKNIKQSKKI